MTKLPKAADGQRHDAEKHHDGAVHRAELVVELGEHDAHRCLRVAEPAADDRNRMERIRQLKPHQHHQAETEQQKQQPGDGVLDTDHLVVHREHVLAPEAQLLVGVIVRVPVFVGRSGYRLLQRRTPSCDGCGMGVGPKAKRAIVCRRYKVAQAEERAFEGVRSVAVSRLDGVSRFESQPS